MSLHQLFINNSFKLIAVLENSGDFIFRTVGLTLKTYGVLYLISTGLDTSKSLLGGTYGSKPNMTKKLKFLEENEFVSRSIDLKDKRMFRFQLTQKAIESLEKISPIYDAATAIIFLGISDAEIKTAIHVIEKCLKNCEMCPKIPHNL
jgi:DNA-binding MarR family transcriptional regulator